MSPVGSKVFSTAQKHHTELAVRSFSSYNTKEQNTKEQFRCFWRCTIWLNHDRRCTSRGVNRNSLWRSFARSRIISLCITERHFQRDQYVIQYVFKDTCFDDGRNYRASVGSTDMHQSTALTTSWVFDFQYEIYVHGEYKTTQCTVNRRRPLRHRRQRDSMTDVLLRDLFLWALQFLTTDFKPSSGVLSPMSPPAHQVFSVIPFNGRVQCNLVNQSRVEHYCHTYAGSNILAQWVYG